MSDELTGSSLFLWTWLNAWATAPCRPCPLKPRSTPKQGTQSFLARQQKQLLSWLVWSFFSWQHYVETTSYNAHLIQWPSGFSFSPVPFCSVAGNWWEQGSLSHNESTGSRWVCLSLLASDKWTKSKTWPPPGSAGIMKHKHGKKAFKVLSTCLEIHEPGSMADSICIKEQIRQKIASQ